MNEDKMVNKNNISFKEKVTNFFKNIGKKTFS